MGGDGCGDNALKLCNPQAAAIPMPSPSPPVTQPTHLTCTSFTCPAGWVKRSQVYNLVCTATGCTKELCCLHPTEAVPAPVPAAIPSQPAVASEGTYVCKDADASACGTWHNDPAGDQCVTNKEVMQALCMQTCGLC